MKTLIVKSLILVAALIQTFALFSCSSGGGGSSTPVATYSLLGGQCYNNLNQPVTLSLCSTNGYSLNTLGQCINTATQQLAPSQTYCTTGFGGIGTGVAGYGYVNGQCVLLANPAQIAPSTTYCSTTGIGGVGTSQVCIGQYTWISPYGGRQTGICQSYGGMNNCSGYTMINSLGQSVLCQ